MGLAEGSLFISLNAGLETRYHAIAIAGLLLSGSIGFTVGVSTSSVVLTATLRKLLHSSLKGVEGAQKIIDRTISDISYVMALKGRLHELTVHAYIMSLEYSHALSLAFATAALAICLFLVERKL
ncbi:hypothetical protein EV356DRAFT_527986 [Viridothelium virens]|uniref:Uncharacterized protein n=1 Tax=Viridothelium virens TaxID=1048519 RepID=A0A6A6HQN5_VIRVR|nr:hypothetical protein EV356DRAFT_527986 [Viridothelium virens]